MNLSIILLSQILKILKKWESIDKTIFRKIKENFRIQEIGNVCERHYQMYMCTKFQVDILKNDLALDF